MPIVTRLVQGKKNPNRVNLYLDDQFAFALSIDEVAKHGLKKGVELSQLQIEELKKTDELGYVYAKILNYLSYRPHSIKEVRDRLFKYKVQDKPTQEMLLSKLISQGYLDDLKFAQWFIDSRNQHRPRSHKLLSAELSKMGVSREIIAQLQTSMGDELHLIERVLHKKLGSPHPLDQPTRQKIYAYLSRQGYAWESIKKVVKKWESE